MFCNLIPTKAEMAKRIMKNAAPEYPMVLLCFIFDFFFAKIRVKIEDLKFINQLIQHYGLAVESSNRPCYKTPFVEGKISKSLISRLVAILIALAKALKMASIL
jgi:uncharacterized membrane protein